MTGIDDPYEEPVAPELRVEPGAARRSRRRGGRPPLSGGRAVGQDGPVHIHHEANGVGAGGAADARVRRVVPHVRQHRRRPVHRPHGDRVGHARPRLQRLARGPGRLLRGHVARRHAGDPRRRRRRAGRHARPLARRLPVAGDGHRPPRADRGAGARRHRARLPQRRRPRRLERDGRGLRPRPRRARPRRPARQRRAERQRAPQRRGPGARRPRRAAAVRRARAGGAAVDRRADAGRRRRARQAVPQRVAVHGRQDPRTPRWP